MKRTSITLPVYPAIRLLQMSLCLLVSSSSTLLAQDQPVQPKPVATGANNVPVNQHKVEPLVVMEKTALTGRIVFMQEDEKDEDPGADLDIQILTENKRKSIYETRTDDQGLYQIPNLDAGLYWMQIGQLTLRLRVNTIKEAKAAAGSTNAPDADKPKVLVIFIPRDLA